MIAVDSLATFFRSNGDSWSKSDAMLKMLLSVHPIYPDGPDAMKVLMCYGPEQEL